jgi:hypothetical protein
MSKATSRVADATAAVAGGVVGAAVEGVIGGIQGAAKGIRDGWSVGSRSHGCRVDVGIAKGGRQS